MNRARTLATTVAGVGLAMALGACGGGDDASPESGEDESPTAASGGELTVVGRQAFTEMAIMQEIYLAAARGRRYTVDIQSAESRELYAPALESGEIDVAEYAATMAEYLNARKNGPEAPVNAPIATRPSRDRPARRRSPRSTG